MQRAFKLSDLSNVYVRERVYAAIMSQESDHNKASKLLQALERIRKGSGCSSREDWAARVREIEAMARKLNEDLIGAETPETIDEKMANNPLGWDSDQRCRKLGCVFQLPQRSRY